MLCIVGKNYTGEVQVTKKGIFPYTLLCMKDLFLFSFKLRPAELSRKTEHRWTAFWPSPMLDHWPLRMEGTVNQYLLLQACFNPSLNETFPKSHSSCALWLPLWNLSSHSCPLSCARSLPLKTSHSKPSLGWLFFPHSSDLVGPSRRYDSSGLCHMVFSFFLAVSAVSQNTVSSSCSAL